MSDEAEPRLIVPGLPTLYEGEFVELIAELEDNEESFFHRVETHMNEDNNAGLLLIAMISEGSPDIEASFKLLTLYYELFSRAARRSQGFEAMIILNDETINALADEYEEDTRRVKIGDEAVATEVLENRYYNAQSRIARDKDKNPELRKFWEYAEEIEERLRGEGLSTAQITMVFTSVFEIQELFYRQDAINASMTQFKIPDYIPPLAE